MGREEREEGFSAGDELSGIDSELAGRVVEHR
jgi:hypothetical protein